MRHKFKKLLSLVLALILCFSMAQPAYAAYYKIGRASCRERV